MTDADNTAIKFKAYTNGEPIPSVDSDDIRKTWEYDRTHSRVNANGWEWLIARRAVCSDGADVDDVGSRCHMIDRLVSYDKGHLIGPWKHGDELDPVVFRIAATFPLRCVEYKNYQMPGDDLWEFDPNAFVRQLMEETGVQHTWQEITIRVSGGGRHFVRCTIGNRADPNTEARRSTRQLLWSICERCNDLMSTLGKDHPEVATGFFADFLIDNIELVQKVENGFKTQRFPELSILQEAEEKAAHWRP